MIVRPEDRGKVTGLVVAIILVAVTLAWRLHSVSSPEPVAAEGQVVSLSGPGSGTTPQATPAEMGNVAPSSATLVSSAGEGDDGSDQIEVPTLFASATADPFRSVVPKAAPVATAAVIRRPVTLRPRDRMFTSNFEEPPHMSAPLNPMPTSSVVIEKEPVPTLSGLMPGSDGVAVIQSGSDSFVVKKGEKFGNGYSVVSIGKSEVSLRRRDQTITLTMTP